MLPTTRDRRSKHLLLKICHWRSEIIRYGRLFSSLSVGRRIQIFKMECWMRILENETLWKPACPERHRPERHRPQNRIRSFTVVWRFWSEDSRISSATFYMGPCQETKPRKIKVFSRDGCRCLNFKIANRQLTCLESPRLVQTNPYNPPNCFLPIELGLPG